MVGEKRRCPGREEGKKNCLIEGGRGFSKVERNSILYSLEERRFVSAGRGETHLSSYWRREEGGFFLKATWKTESPSWGEPSRGTLEKGDCILFRRRRQGGSNLDRRAKEGDFDRGG